MKFIREQNFLMIYLTKKKGDERKIFNGRNEKRKGWAKRRGRERRQAKFCFRKFQEIGNR